MGKNAENRRYLRAEQRYFYILHNNKLGSIRILRVLRGLERFFVSESLN